MKNKVLETYVLIVGPNHKMEDRTEGIVILRKILTLDEQLKLIDMVERTGGLIDLDSKWNFFGKRGRYFSSLKKYSESDYKFLTEICSRFKTRAETVDSTVTWAPVTHLLTLWYPDTNGMGWHVDSYGGNDGDKGAPVYSLTIGNSCVFEYKLVGTKIKQSVILESGDLIIFGGPQRLMPHSVKKVLTGTFMLKENFEARINLTFRTCTDFSEADEQAYQTDIYTDRLTKKWAEKKNSMI